MFDKSPASGLLPALAFSALLVAAGGCGSGKATVEGKVSSKGIPLSTGNVSFQGEKGRRDASISPDGTYKIPDVDPGEYKVAIEVRTMNFPKPPPGAIPKVTIPGQPKVEGQGPPKAVAVDPKYKDARTSGLTYQIGSGTRRIDIDLK